MHRKGVAFSKMFVLRSMGNELVPSPLNRYAYSSHSTSLIAEPESYSVIVYRVNRALSRQ